MTIESKSVAELAAETKAVFDTKFNEVQAIAEKALAEAGKGIPMSETAKELADQALIGMNEAKSRMDEMEQKFATFRDAPANEQASIGEQMISDPEVKAFMANPSAMRRVGIDAKAIISNLGTNANGSVGSLVEPDRQALESFLRRRLTVRDLISPGRTASNSITYPRISGFVNGAATVSETAGGLKPQSELKTDIVTSNVTTIAHFVLATRQILDDAPQLESIINEELLAGLAEVEENQLLNGAGTGTDLNGIYTQATAFAAGTAVVPNPQRFDVIRFAMLQGSLAYLPATGIVMHEQDWAITSTLKDTTGGYLIGNPQDGTQPSLWGLPVVESLAMAPGTFLTGAFRRGAQIFDRMDARVEISTEDSDNFRRNLVTILCEERLALAVRRPEAFIKGAFAAAITDLTS